MNFLLTLACTCLALFAIYYQALNAQSLLAGAGNPLVKAGSASGQDQIIADLGRLIVENCPPMLCTGKSTNKIRVEEGILVGLKSQFNPILDPKGSTARWSPSEMVARQVWELSWEELLGKAGLYGVYILLQLVIKQK
jgi:hypothetical protein